MRIRTSQKNKKVNNLWGVTHFLFIQNVGTQEGIDSDEYIVMSGEETALISPKPMMESERLQQFHSVRYFALPRQIYEFLDWNRKNGETSENFRIVKRLPMCEDHLEMMIRVPGPFGCRTENGMHYMCPDHAVHYKPIECLFVEEENV